MLVTVRWPFTGEVAFGPELFDPDTPVREIKALIQDDFAQRGNGEVVITLRQGDLELSSSQLLSSLGCSSLLPLHNGEVEIDVAVQELDGEERRRLLGAICADWRALGDLGCPLASDRDAVMVAVRQSGLALQYASGSLRADEQFVKQAVRINAEAMQYVDKRLRMDKLFAQTVVGMNWRTLKHVAKSLKMDRSIVNAAACQNVDALEFADDALLGNSDFMTERVSHTWHAMKFASVALKADREFVLKTARAHVKALEYADAALLSDRMFMLGLIREKWSAFKYAAAGLQRDPKVVGEAIDAAMNFASKALLSEKAGDDLKAERTLALEFASTTLRKRKQAGESSVAAALEFAARSYGCQEAKGPVFVQRLRHDIALGRALPVA